MILFGQIEEAAKLAEHVARQDPSWQLAFVLIVVAFAAGWIARYGAKRLDKVQDENTAYLRECNAKLVSALDRNTTAMVQFAETVAAVKHLFGPRRSHD